MPNYEYQCTQCQHKFELWQSVGEAPPACPDCGQAVKKIFHVPRVIFKGSGFYITDTRAEQSAKSSKSDGESKNESKSDGASKSESKSDTKSNGGSSDAAPTKSSDAASGA